jgi:hypothetical protein
MEKYACKKTSGVAYDFIVKGFGLTAVIIGITLVVLMIFAFMSGGGH